MGSASASTLSREPWNKGKIVGQKAPFKVTDDQAIPQRVQRQRRRAGLCPNVEPRAAASTFRRGVLLGE